MYCRVLACDYDGTGAADGRLAPETAAALALARRDGVVTLLVTGRVLDDLRLAGVPFDAFDAIVAENGAVVLLTASARTIILGEPPPEHFLGELRARGVPFHTGAVVVGTWESHFADVHALVRQLGLDAQLVFNRAAVMVLPTGVDKARGVERAVDELGRCAHDMIAFGDAENDVPLFRLAEVAVAARGSVPAVAARADDRLTQPGPAGVAYFVDRLAAAGWQYPTPPRQRLVIGEDAAGPVALPASDTHVLVSGDPRSGKSFLAGLVVERALEQGRRVCLIDPEGDHVALRERPHVLALGCDLPLPAPDAVPRLLAGGRSVAVDLSSLELRQKRSYVERLLVHLDEYRAWTGMPHWTVVDEAHYFFAEDAPAARLVERGRGTLMLVTYRPSFLAARVHAAIGAHLVTRTRIDDERYFLTELLQARAPAGVAIRAAVDDLDGARAGLLLVGEPPAWRVFAPAARVTRHAHHARKYANTVLPADQGFRFLVPNGGGPTARSVTEFVAGVAAVPPATLRHHLCAGDFSRWAADVLGDRELAAGLRKLERTEAAGGTITAPDVVGHIRDRYAV